jgi:dihydrofolate reductase
MASLVLKMSISLDGFVAPPDGNGAWIAAGASDDARDWNLDIVRHAAAHLMGSVTYTQLAGFYPTSSIPFAEPMNTIPKVVFSNSLTSAEWGPATVASGDLADAVTKLKEEHDEGYLLAHAGPRFVRSLIRTGLIDEYRLMVHPVVLGAGERIFEAPLALDPTSTTVFSAGAVGHVVRPAH